MKKSVIASALSLGVLVASLSATEPAGAAAQTLQKASDIQSKRWSPESLYASELFVHNSFAVPLQLDQSLNFLDNASWHRGPPATIAPGETVKIQIASNSWGRGFKFGFAYQAGTERYAPWVRIGGENLALKKNSYNTWTANGLGLAAADGWGKTWVPKSEWDGSMDGVNSDTFGKSNWAVTTWDLAPLETGAGKNLLAGQWSAGVCNDYRRTAKELKWEKQLQDRLGNAALAAASGLKGAQAGAYLGMLVHGCSN